MAEYVLGIDGGQTTTKAALADLAGNVSAFVSAGPWDSLSNEPGRERSRRALREALDGLLTRVGAGDAVISACLGLTGVMAGSPLVETWLHEQIRPRRLLIVGDIETNLRGANPAGGPGVVVIAGGGSVAWGRDAEGRTALAGAHGYLLDDEGSGYEMGRQAIIAAFKAYHGRRLPTRLTELVPRHFGVADVWAVRGLIYSGQAGRPQVAALMPVIAEAARAGDDAARAILESGARALAEMAGAVVRRLGLTGGPVFPTGGVFRAGPLMLEPFAAALAQFAPAARVAEPALPPLGGALVMALEQAGALTSAAVANLAAGLVIRPAPPDPQVKGAIS